MLLGNLETVYATSVCIFNRTVVTLSSRKTSTLPWEMNSKDFLPITLIHTIRLSIHNLTFTYSEDRVQYLVQECFNVQTREASDRTTDLLMGRCSTSWGRAAQTWVLKSLSAVSCRDRHTLVFEGLWENLHPIIFHSSNSGLQRGWSLSQLSQYTLDRSLISRRALVKVWLVVKCSLSGTTKKRTTWIWVHFNCTCNVTK